MYTDPLWWFNTTFVNTTPANLVNGTLIPGHFEVIAEVYGMDLIVSLLIVMAFFQVMTFIYMVFGRNLRRFKK